MSRRAKMLRRQRLAAEKRKEQVALQPDYKLGEKTELTIGEMVNRLNLSKVNVPILTQPQSVLPIAPAPVVAKDWPECPETCDATEWRIALENRDYYLLKASQDNNQKPWFQYPKVQNQYSEFVFLMPEMSEQLLSHMPINRKRQTAHVEKLRRDIVNHRWLQTHESICVNKLGNMQDGQHRADAIIKAGMGWPIYITWNVPPSGIYATDSGNKRPVNEKLQFLFPELKLSAKTAAMCRSMMAGLDNRSVNYTESELAAFMFAHARVVNWTCTNLKSYRADLLAVIAKAVLWWGEAVISPFVERLNTIQFTGDGDPAKALYLWLQSAKQQGKRTAYTSPLLYYKKTLAAVHAFVCGKNSFRLFTKENDIFEWLPGWKVPASAPCGEKVFIDEDLNKPLEV